MAGFAVNARGCYCTKEVLHKSYWKTVYRKVSFPRKESDTNFLQSIYFAYEVGIISSNSNTICYWKTAKSRTKDVWELQAALRTVFENHCSTSNPTPASYDATALAIIKPKKHQSLADPLLQSGVATRNIRVSVP